MDAATDLGWWGVVISVVGGAIRVSTPYLFVSLGETLTEKGGRVNLGLEGILVMGAMSGYGVAYLTGEPWLGVLVAGMAGAALALVHALVCNLPRVNDIAVGISLFIFGTGLAFFLGKPLIQPSAPRLPHLELGAWSAYPQVRSALEINTLFIVGV
ncbi:MAG: ABC transporter permease, partial [Gammaproteobacteria bacterium]|nr:ABC transporter permease [Gammaproteobacteria bacterium]